MKKHIKDGYEDVKEFILNNKLMIIFIITCLINGVVLKLLTIGSIGYLKSILGDLIVLLFICSFSFLLKPAHRHYWYFGWSIFLCFLCCINSVYYNFYTAFTSISLLETAKQVADVGDAVMDQILRIIDLIYIWGPITVIGSYYLFIKNDTRKSNVNFLTSFVISLIITSFFVFTLTPLEVGRLYKQWNKEYIVNKFGIYIYHVNDIFSVAGTKLTTIFGSKEAYANFLDFYENFNPDRSENEYTNIFEGKNIISIHAESIQTNALNLEFNGQAVTPNLNRIISEGIYFNNYYSPVSIGTSSDAEFMLNTSLLPVTNGTVFVTYPDSKYEALPSLLNDKGYYCFSMHGNKRTFWNRNAMHKNFGYDRFYAKENYEIDEVIGLGLSDSSFFRQSVPIIKDEVLAGNTPFYMTSIMLSNHTPFVESGLQTGFKVTMDHTFIDESGNEIVVENDYLEGTKLGEYFKSVNYADKAIGEFLDALDKEGLLENTVVIIYGDHDARLSYEDYDTFYNYGIECDDTNYSCTDYVKDSTYEDYFKVDKFEYEKIRRVPFIIWTKDSKNSELLNKELDIPMSTIDILPTLANMFNIKLNYAIGNDIFNLEDNTVVFPNGNFVTKDVMYNGQKESFILLNDVELSDDFIAKNVEYVNKMLKVSNDIIVYDLIRYKEEGK